MLAVVPSLSALLMLVGFGGPLSMTMRRAVS